MTKTATKEKPSLKALDTFIVEPNKKYLITENVDMQSSTPPALKNVGRVKMGKFKEYVGCPFNESTNQYDTGFYESSYDFIGKTKEEKTKTLKDREKLSEYLKSLCMANGCSEVEFLSGEKNNSPFKLEVAHNLTVDTSTMDNYLRLYLAMRSGKIVPPNAKGSSKYINAMYKIEDIDKTTEVTLDKVSQKYEIISWFNSLLTTNPDIAADIAIVENIISSTVSKKPSIILQAFDLKMNNDSSFLEKMKIRRDIPLETTKVEVHILRLIAKGYINRKDNNYYFENRKIGTNKADIKFFIEKLENRDISERLMSIEC